MSENLYKSPESNLEGAKGDPESAMPPESTSRVHLKIVFRDLVVLLAFSAVVGMIVGGIGKNFDISNPETARNIGLINTLFTVTAFVVIGSLAPGSRFLHLAAVGLGYWLVSVVNIFILPGFGLIQWVALLGVVIAWVVVGWAVSYVFVRRSSDRA